MSALTIGGSPVDVARGGWREEDPYPAQASDGVDSLPRSPVTTARGHRRTVRFRSVEMSRADAKALESALMALPVSLAGDLPGGARTAVAEDLVLEPWPGDPVRTVAVSCRFLFDPVEEEA